MIKYLFIFLLTVGCATQSYSQPGHYSTSNKKAIKLFEQGMDAPNQSIDPTNNYPNFRLGIKYLEQAIEKDPNFWEAHLVAGEFYEKLHEYQPAIDHYKAAIHINPRHTATGSTYFYLGNLLFATGEYADSKKVLEQFIANRNAAPALVKEANLLLNNCDFAEQSMRNPTKFNPINVGPGINTADPEYFPTITVDGKTILFTRRIKDARSEMDGMQEDFFISQYENKEWQKAVPMPSNINTVNNEGAPTLAPDGRSLVFVACPDMSGKNYGEGRYGRGSCDMFYTKKLGSRWTDPVNLPGNANTHAWESQPSLSSDGKTMYFIRRVSRPGEPADSDIFVTRLLEDGTWSTAERLPNYINTKSMEESVLIHPDGRTLYFASRGHIGMGGSDLYVCRMDENGNWSRPENLGYPINTKYDENSLMVGPEGDIAFFASNRAGGYGDLDIYYFSMPEHLRPTKTLYFEGKVFDAVTYQPVPGKFQLIDLKTGKEVIVAEADKLTGEFMVSLPVNREYALNVTYPGYTFFSQNFNMTNPEGMEAIHMDVPLVPLTGSDMAISLKNVFFDLNKATLRPESFVELNKLVDFMKEHETIKIEIGGHTDTRGDAKDNQILSQNRAQSVVDYLVKYGIDKSRLIARGYGETQPKFTDEVINAMQTDKEREAAHQENRRTEYKIIK